MNSRDNFEILFFELENGVCPVEDFLNELDVKMAAKIYGLMDVLSEKGNSLREPYSK